MDILEYYNLNEQPFRTSPDPRFLYLSDQVKEALAKVEYMTRERIGPLYIYGSIGSGKTSLLRRLFTLLHDDQRYIVQLLFTPNTKTPTSSKHKNSKKPSPVNQLTDRLEKNQETRNLENWETSEDLKITLKRDSSDEQRTKFPRPSHQAKGHKMKFSGNQDPGIPVNQKAGS